MYIWEDAMKKLIELDVRCKQTRDFKERIQKKRTQQWLAEEKDEWWDEKKRQSKQEEKGNEEKQTSLRNKTV